MLPFQKDKKTIAGLIIAKRKPDGGHEEFTSEDSDSDGLEMACQEMMKAFKADDSKAFSAALRSAFEILDSEPHEEYDHSQDE